MVLLAAVVQSSVKSSVQGRRPISSTAVPTAIVPFIRPASRSVSKWFEVEHAVKLKVKILWLSWKSYSIVGHRNGGKVTLILLTVSQFKDVDQETDKPHFIKHAITALPTTFGTRGVCKFKKLCSKEGTNTAAVRNSFEVTSEGHKKTTWSLKRTLC